MVFYDPYTAQLTTSIPTATMPTQQQQQPPQPLHPTTTEEAAYEREKAAITSYEAGWDRWDGPIWPVGTIQCRFQEDQHIQKELAREEAAIQSYEQGWDRWDGPVWPTGTVQCHMRKCFLEVLL
jgi:hypothetical protein|tara:strand:+ start:13076 stop:13447 length:372 start_codon:yes stop_codon:yes gene_type:complete